MWQYRENPDFSRRGKARGGERREREKRGEGQRREARAETTQVQSGTTPTPSHSAARGEGAVDIYRKRDRAAVTPSHPDGGSRERAGRGVPLACAVRSRPRRARACPSAEGDPESATSLTCQRCLRLDQRLESECPNAARPCSPAPDGTGSPICKARPAERCAEQ